MYDIVFYVLIGAVPAIVMMGLALPMLSSIASWLRPVSFAGAHASASKVRMPAPTPVPQEVEEERTPLMVRDLSTQATLVMLERPSRGCVDTRLIVWSAEEGGKKVQQKYLELGMLPGSRIESDLVTRAIALAKIKLDELDGKAPAAADVEAAKPVEEQESQFAKPAKSKKAKASMVEQTNEEQDPQIKLLKKPVSHRGIVLQMGMMPRALDSGERPCYGVRYRTEEGVEDVLWGVGLRTEFTAAKVGIGDHVEILKIGRKVMEEGKAPMNLYRVTKFDE